MSNPNCRLEAPILWFYDLGGSTNPGLALNLFSFARVFGPQADTHITGRSTHSLITISLPYEEAVLGALT